MTSMLQMSFVWNEQCRHSQASEKDVSDEINSRRRVKVVEHEQGEDPETHGENFLEAITVEGGDQIVECWHATPTSPGNN